LGLGLGLQHSNSYSELGWRVGGHIRIRAKSKSQGEDCFMVRVGVQNQELGQYKSWVGLGFHC
jgi:hypothetical protein